MRAAVLIAGLVLFAPQLALAEDSFRCPNDRLLKIGDTLATARARCGAPSNTSRRNEKRKSSSYEQNGNNQPIVVEHETSIEIEDWHFDLGRNRLVRTLRFENGRLAAITTGTYGEGK